MYVDPVNETQKPLMKHFTVCSTIKMPIYGMAGYAEGDP